MHGVLNDLFKIKHYRRYTNIILSEKINKILETKHFIIAQYCVQHVH